MAKGLPRCPDCTKELDLTGSKLTCSGCFYQQQLPEAPPRTRDLFQIVPKSGCPECGGVMVPQMRSKICASCGFSTSFVA